MTLKIGITGGIGAGKSLACKLFSHLGVPVFNADMEAKALYYEPNVKHQVIQLLGDEAYLDDTHINKAYIADKIFNDDRLLSGINTIIHPTLRVRFGEWVTEQSAPYILQESAILFESDLYKSFDKSIVVTAPIDIRVSRVLQRPNMTKQTIMERMAKQMQDEERISLADYHIVNDAKHNLIAQVVDIHTKLLRE